LIHDGEEFNGKKYKVEIEWSGKRGTYSQWWRTWAAPIVDGKTPISKIGSYWNSNEWIGLNEIEYVGYDHKYTLSTQEAVVAALSNALQAHL